MKTKEYNEAVERLLPHIADIHSGDIYEARKIISKIIDALGIEIVSKFDSLNEKVNHMAAVYLENIKGEV